MADEAVGLEIVASRPGGKGTSTLTATFNGQVVHSDKIDLCKAADRKRFASDLQATHGGISTEELEAKLLTLVPAPSTKVEGGAPGADDSETQAEALLRLARSVRLFRTPDGQGYATVPLDEHEENHPLGSRAFVRWLTREFYLEQGKPPSSEAIRSAVGVLEAKALYEAPVFAVHTRVAPMSAPADPDRPTIYLNLANERRQVVEITSRGWQLIDRAPVKMRTPKGMLGLPTPTRGGSLKALRPFVNVGSEHDWRLLIATLTAMLRPTGPYPIGVFQGEQGSAKSTTTRATRRLVDPHTTLLRSEPREVRDLMIAANHSWVISIDNISELSTWLSDAFCRLATGGGFATRTLYADDEETHFEAMRPILLNGIDDVATKFDLLDRAIVFRLPTIPEDRRREEAPFWREFEADHPAILGALLDAVVGGLDGLPSVRLERLPRMADFARWGESVGRHLGWGEGAFIKAYESNRSASNEQAIDGSLFASAVRDLILNDHRWEGTASDLGKRLAELVGEKASRSRDWPKSPRALSGSLRRSVPALRHLGIQVEFDRSTDAKRSRLISIVEGTAEEGGERPSEPSEPSRQTPANRDKPQPRNNLRKGADSGRSDDRSKGHLLDRPSSFEKGECRNVRVPNQLSLFDGQDSDGSDGSDGLLPGIIGETAGPREVGEL